MSNTPLADDLEHKARLWGRTIMAGYGAPADMVMHNALPRAEAIKLRALITAFEIMVRHFLVALARMLTPPALRQRGPRARGARKVPPPPTHDTPSESWAGVSFRITPRTYAPRVQHAQRPRHDPRAAIVITSLALRLEAAIRVIHHPDRAALRMARYLAPDADKKRVRALLLARPGRKALGTSRALTDFFADHDREAALAPLLDSS